VHDVCSNFVTLAGIGVGNFFVVHFLN